MKGRPRHFARELPNQRHVELEKAIDALAHRAAYYTQACSGVVRNHLQSGSGAVLALRAFRWVARHHAAEDIHRKSVGRRHGERFVVEGEAPRGRTVWYIAGTDAALLRSHDQRRAV